MDKKGASRESRTLSIQYAQRELREEPLWSNKALMYEQEASETFLAPELWYHDICIYLVRGTCPEHMDASHRRALKLKSNMYHLANNIL